VGNGRFYGGGLVVAPQAGLAEGLLYVYALPWGSWRDLLGVARSFKSGAFVHRPGVHHYRTAHIHIATQPLLPSTWMGNWLAAAHPLRRRPTVLVCRVGHPSTEILR
jgi:diacylglycerol kinase family enzyme